MHRTLTILAAAPGDAAADRGVLESLIDHLNGGAARVGGVHLDLHFLEGPADRLASSDNALFVTLLWSRFDLGDANGSGERDLRSALLTHRDNPGNRGVAFFFKDEPLPPSRIDAAQLARVQVFKQEIERGGEDVHVYRTEAELWHALETACARVIAEIAPSTPESPSQSVSETHAQPMATQKPEPPHLKDALTPPILSPAANDDRILAALDEPADALVAEIDRKAWSMLEEIDSISEIVSYMANDLARRHAAFGHFGESNDDDDLSLIQSGMIRKQESQMQAFAGEAEGRAAKLREIYHAALNGMRIEIHRRQQADGTNALTAEKRPILESLRRYTTPLAGIETHVRALRSQISGVGRTSAEFHKAKLQALEYVDNFLADSAELRTILTQAGES